MKTIAFIPAKGYSDRILCKNIMPICGKPLIYYSIKSALKCCLIDEVWVSTEDEEVKEIALKYGAKVDDRHIELSGKHVTTEEVMIEYANRNIFDNIILIQATSPYTTCHDLSRSIKMLKDFDSIISATHYKRFLWTKNSDNIMCPITHGVKRLMSQEMDSETYPFYQENGAFYITSRDSLLVNKCRFGEKTGVYLMEYDHELDVLEDVVEVEKIMKGLIEKGHWK